MQKKFRIVRVTIKREHFIIEAAHQNYAEYMILEDEAGTPERTDTSTFIEGKLELDVITSPNRSRRRPGPRKGKGGRPKGSKNKPKE